MQNPETLGVERVFTEIPVTPGVSEMETCKYCEKVIRYGVVMFGGSPLHPECYDELQREMFGDEPLPESVLDLPWGGHPSESALDMIEIPF